MLGFHELNHSQKLGPLTWTSCLGLFSLTLQMLPLLVRQFFRISEHLGGLCPGWGEERPRSGRIYTGRSWPVGLYTL